MGWKVLTIGGAAMLGLVLCGQGALAQDNVKLSLDPASAGTTQNLLLTDDNNADTEEVWYRHYYRPFHGYGYRPFYGYGYRPFYGYGYRPFYGYGYRPFYGYAYRPFFYRPFYPALALSFYQPYYYAPPYYDMPPAAYYYPPSYYYYPASLSSAMNAPNLPAVIPQGNGQQLPPPRPVPAPPVPAAPASGTYRYDGGPANPVPLPKTGSPQQPAPGTIPLEGRSVSLTAPPVKKYAYPAYGEAPARPNVAEERTIVIKK
jgi:hypothetical protein